MDQNQNSGLIVKDPTPIAWVVGVETGAQAVVVNPSADWRAYEPRGEWQALIWTDKNGVSYYKDTVSCVSFSANNNLETFLNFMIKNEKFPNDAIQWLRSNGYFDENGNVNFSDRFTAKMSNTSKQGNSLESIWQSIHNNGLVSEKDWSMPIDAMKADPANYWETYMSEIPANVIAKGKLFATLFPVDYEWLAFQARPLTDDQFREALKIAPIQIATAVCWPWNTDKVILGCGDGANHATQLSFIEESGQRDIFDTYDPFGKHLSGDYHLTWAMRGVIRSLIMPINTPVRLNHVFSKQLRFGMPIGPEVKLMQTALQMLISPVSGKPYMKPGTFGAFGPVTRVALGLFQTDHGIPDPDGQGTNFGPKTRDVMNAEITKLNS